MRVHRGRASLHPARGRTDPRGLSRGAGPSARHRLRRHRNARQNRGGGEGKNRHPQPARGLQPRIRLLHRGRQGAAFHGTGLLHPQADACQWRALHHPGAEGAGKRDPHGQGSHHRAGIRAFYAGASGACGAGRARPAHRAGGGLRGRAGGFRGGRGQKQLLPPGDRPLRRNRNSRRPPSRGRADAQGEPFRPQRHPAGHGREPRRHPDRAEHGRQIHLYASGRADRPDGADRQLRAGKVRAHRRR